MEKIYTWIIENHTWFFSGLGVLILSFILTYFFRKRNRSNIHIGDEISVRGCQSIGKVKGNVEIKINDQTKKKN